MKASQIPLDLPFNAALARDDLIVTPANAFAAGFVDAWPDWPGHAVVLVGPQGSGKTHLARIWAAAASALVVDAASLAAGGREAAQSGPVVVEDVQAGRIAETGLFHLLNAVRAAGHHCLMTSRVAPREWGVRLPDLASRLRAAHLVELNAPDDALLARVMVKQFADRQIAIDPGVVDYVVHRMERSLAAVGALVAEMDREALSRNRRVTRAIAAGALGRLGAG